MKFFLSILFLISQAGVALACPDLNGTYECAEKFRITISTEPGNQMTIGVDSDKSLKWNLEGLNLKSDGIDHDYSKEFVTRTVRVSCVGDTVTINSREVYESDDLPIHFEGSYKFTQLLNAIKIDTFTKISSGSSVYNNSIQDVCLKL